MSTTVKWGWKGEQNYMRSMLLESNMKFFADLKNRIHFFFYISSHIIPWALILMDHEKCLLPPVQGRGHPSSTSVNFSFPNPMLNLPASEKRPVCGQLFYLAMMSECLAWVADRDRRRRLYRTFFLKWAIGLSIHHRLSPVRWHDSFCISLYCGLQCCKILKYERSPLNLPLALWGLSVIEKMSENAFSPKNGWIEKLMVPSESAQEHSNEWSCQYVLTVLGQFLCPALGDRYHHQSLKS
jgi:hypothetical protein